MTVYSVLFQTSNINGGLFHATLYLDDTSVLATNSVVVCPSFMEMETTSMSGVD